MGSFVELNDTLQITTEQGFPADILDLEKHRRGEIKLEDIKDKVFTFKDKPNARIYHPAPNRCFFAHNIGGKRLFWGNIIMLEQTITKRDDENFTSGKYRIVKLYDPEFQRQMTINESPEGLSYF